MEKKGNPWIIVAVILGILCAGVISLYVLMLVQKSGEEVSQNTDTEETMENTESSDVNSTMLSASVPYENEFEQIDLKDASFSYKKGGKKKNEEKDSKDEDDLEGMNSDFDSEDMDEEASDDKDYFLSESDSRKLTEDDLEGLDSKDLTYARNEIYARHGKVFNAKELNEYFGEKDWYKADKDFDDNEISDIERKNAEFIKKYQNDNNLMYKPN